LFQNTAHDQSNPEDSVRLVTESGIADPAAAKKYYRNVTGEKKAWQHLKPEQIQIIEAHLAQNPSDPDITVLQRLIPDRSAKAIRAKTAEMKPTAKFTEEDDKVLLKFHSRFGGCWDTVA
jgi:hypothetical protein